MSHRMIRALPFLALAGLTACQSASPRSANDAATLAACREQADRVYAQQNRVDLSRRDERDTPFASTYNSGITTRGLGARYERGRQIAACTSGGGPGGEAGTGPTFSPAVQATEGTTVR